MRKRKGLDIKDLKIIDEDEVPAKPKRYTPYREIFRRIQKGKALVISDEEIGVDTARAAIRRLQKKGEFAKLIVTQRKGEDGIKRLYIINPSEEKSE